MKLGLGLYRHQLNREHYDFARQCGATHVVGNPSIDEGRDEPDSMPRRRDLHVIDHRAFASVRDTFDTNFISRSECHARDAAPR